MFIACLEVLPRRALFLNLPLGLIFQSQDLNVHRLNSRGPFNRWPMRDLGTNDRWKSHPLNCGQFPVLFIRCGNWRYDLVLTPNADARSKLNDIRSDIASSCGQSCSGKSGHLRSEPDSTFLESIQKGDKTDLVMELSLHEFGYSSRLRFHLIGTMWAYFSRCRVWE